jgi:hypothetical protein
MTGRPSERSQVASLAAIAKKAAIGQILGNRQTAVFFTDDVIDFAAVKAIILVDETILTPSFSPESNETT